MKKIQCTVCKKMFASCGIHSHLVYAHDRKLSEAKNMVRARRIAQEMRPKNSIRAKESYSKAEVIKVLEWIVKKLKG